MKNQGSVRFMANRGALFILVYLMFGQLVPIGISSAQSNGWKLYNDILIPGHIRPGYLAIPIESMILEKCRKDMRDIRIVDSKSSPAPIQIRRVGLGSNPTPYPVRVFRVLREHDQWTDIWIDKTTKSLAECLIIKTPTNGFIRNVEIRGSDNARDAFVIRQDGLIAAFGAPVKLRSLDIRHPLNNFQYLHVRIHDGGEKPLKISGAACCPPKDHKPPMQRAIRIIDINENNNKEVLTIIGDLGKSRHPVSYLDIGASKERYLAKCEVFGSSSATGAPWNPVHSGAIFRLEKNGAVKERNRLMFSPVPSRYLKIELRGDTPEIDSITAGLTMVVVVFKYDPKKEYRLIYGNRKASERGPILTAIGERLDAALAQSKDIQLGQTKRIPPQHVKMIEEKKDEKESASWILSISWKVLGIAVLLLGLLLLFRAMVKSSRRPRRY